MADNLSPLVNLDLINKIYKTINAQITERVYDPQHKPGVALGADTSRYSNAYLQALNVQGNATISGNTSTGTLNDLTLEKADTGFVISERDSSKTLTVSATIVKDLTVGTADTGAVIIRSRGAGNTTIAGPDGKTVELIDGAYTDSAKTANADTPEVGKLLKIKNVDAKTFLAGPKTGTAEAPDYRSIVASDLPEDLTFSNAATASQVKTITTNSDVDHHISFVNNDNAEATAETVYTSPNLTYNPNTGTLGATKLAGELGASNIAGTLGVEHGGTGISSFTAGDILYASDATTLSVLSKGSKGQVLKMGESSPSWGTDNTPTTFTWIDGDIEGPTGSLSGDGMTDVDFAAIPSASESTSGVVTTDTQTFAGVKTFSSSEDSTSNTTGAVTISGGLGVAKNIYAGAVHNAVWNDLVDCIEVPEDTLLEFGYCYSWDDDSVVKSSHSTKNCIGIHSNTAGFVMGEKKTKAIQAAVAGFVLAYVDKLYPAGTPLTWGDNGVLTKCSLLKRVLHPERVIATFYKEESEEKWHNLPVSGRHWVKIA